ncbi:MAG: tRNA (adenine-N1)-methyltransferase [Chloroflexota bacterium]|nr:tRNA (adenine-N1)-methyltransferase [Chloroflexota bacterium]MDE2683105.1 tRNA (adenine-N1)-methyltransferase [Chloroflexota bacterium]
MITSNDASPDAHNDAASNNLFVPGELALFLDRKGRAYLQTLTQGEEFHCHLGFIPHAEVIGQAVGGWYTTSRGHVLLGIRPTLGDYVRLMPRGPQVIYAKDLGNIVSMADIFPGATVVEAGLGSGALTTGLLRAVGPAGRLVSYEINESVVAKAESNVKSVISDTSRWTVKVGDIAEGIDAKAVNRVVLDLPEPWRVLDAAANALSTGGILLCFLPTVLQVHELVLALQDDGRYARIETAETMLRGWNVTRRSVRPAHRMVAHSGFITTAVRCVPPSRQGYALNP